MDYSTLSVWSSAIDVALYLALGVIAIRRLHTAAPPLPERAEAGFITGLFVISVITLVGALTIGHPDLADLAKFVGSSIRGALMACGLVLLAYYWQVRRAWL